MSGADDAPFLVRPAQLWEGVSAMRGPTTTGRPLTVVLLVLALAACGGGGGGSSESVPSISNLQYQPTFVLQFDGNGQSTIGGSFDFRDTGADLATFTMTTSQGATLTEPMTGAAGLKSGTALGAVVVDTTVIGQYTFQLYVTDARGNRSNSLSGSFEVRVNDTGSRWTVQSLPLPSGSLLRLQDVVHNGSLYVAVGEGIFTSPDAVTWTERQIGVTAMLNDVMWSGSQFVAVGEGATILTSPDGVSWTLQPVPAGFDQKLNGVAASSGRLVAVGTEWNTQSTNEELILTSLDGSTWARATQHYSMALYDIVWSGTKFIAVGTILGGTNAEAGVLVSSDGVDWTKHTVGSLNVLQNVSWNGAQFVATGYAGAVRSTDGITWTQVGQGTVSGGAIGWSGQRYLVCDIVYCQSSTDGIQWTGAAQLPGIGPYVRGLTWGGTKWVAVGYANNEPMVLTSP